jgi:hypothetical protein
MQACPECGCHELEARTIPGARVVECGICGSVHGDEEAVSLYREYQSALAAGEDPGVYGLARRLAALPAVSVVRPSGRVFETGGCPELAFVLLDGAGLVQLENVAKTLALASGSMLLRWRIELRVGASLEFVLRADAEPVHGDSPRPAAEVVADASRDMQLLAAAIDRDQRLSWWRR